MWRELATDIKLFFIWRDGIEVYQFYVQFRIRVDMADKIFISESVAAPGSHHV